MATSVKDGNHPYHRVNGLLVPKFIKQSDVDDLKSFQLYPDDVWIVTYPKCGTTWAQQIVRLIRNNGEQDGLLINVAIPWLEALAGYPYVKVDDLPRPRAYKSHFPYSLMPCGPPHTTLCKYIFVARNPKDVAVSLYFHQKLRGFPDRSWDSFWEEFVGGDSLFGSYFDHLVDWWPHRDDDNILFLKYEDMKKDLPHAVSRIASIMGVELSDMALEKIVHLSSFEVMKHDDTANYSWTAAQKKDNATSFLRKGTVGDWKNFLTAEQSAEIDALCEERLKKIGLDFDFVPTSK